MDNDFGAPSPGGMSSVAGSRPTTPAPSAAGDAAAADQPQQPQQDAAAAAAPAADQTTLLQNEADQEFVIREKKLLAQEKAIMSQVPGWEAGKSQYNGTRWTPPHIMDASRSNQKK